MQYGLSELLQDRTLRGKLADASFVFADGNGVFDLDFQEQSIRKNHRKTFDRLMELGGEALLQKLLDEEKTCLVGERGNGTSTIAGTDRFFLKTNAGAPTALASIFYGIAGWAEQTEDFDPELVTCTLEDEESGEDADSDDSWEAMLGFGDSKEARWGEPLPMQVCSLITRNGAPSFFDEEKKEFISLPGTDGPVAELAACEPLSGADGKMMGYRYRTEPNGKWGYVSRHFTQIVPPRFDEMLVARYGDAASCMFAWSDDSSDLLPQFNIVCSVEDPYDQQEVWLDLKGDFAVGDKEQLPGEDGWRQYSSDRKFLLYRPSAKAKKGLLRGPELLQRWEVTFLPGFLTLENCLGTDCTRWVALDFEAPSLWLADTCQKTLSAPLPDFTIKKCLGEKTALIEKEGYWAVAQLCNDAEDCRLQVERWLTPLAFTRVEVLAEDTPYLLVDRFGQLGVLDWKQEKYIVPCRYDRIEGQKEFFFGYVEGFRVHQGGFVGTIGTDGSWKEHLHREEQE